jgi:hypothetical protein
MSQSRTIIVQATTLLAALVLGCIGAIHIHSESVYWPKHTPGPIAWSSALVAVGVLATLAALGAALAGIFTGSGARADSPKLTLLSSRVFWIAFFALFGLGLRAFPAIF